MLWLLLACTADPVDSSNPDADGDGYVEDDCNEGRADTFPGADELCDGWDNDCDDAIDEAPTNGTAFYADADGDGRGGGDPVWSCSPVQDLVTNADDCDDSDALAWTGASEVCGDGSDNDCNGDADCDDDACLEELACQEDTAFEGATQLNLVTVDYASQTPLEGVDADGGDDAATSDAGGALTLVLGYEEPLEVQFTKADYPLHTLSGHGGPAGELTVVNAGFPMISNSTLTLLAGAMGISIDPTKGLVNVSIVGWDGGHVPGVTVVPSVTFDAALVPDSDSSTGLSPGNTTLDGSVSSVFFVNAEAGATTYTVTPPDGLICLEAPGASLPIDANTTAAAVNGVMVVCVPQQ